MRFDTNGHPIYCERCEEQLKPGREVWLELNTRTGLYHAEGDFPADGLSQGWFTFGSACAKRELADTRKAEAAS